MLKPRRIMSMVPPNKFENLGNGNWYYNYDIKSNTVDTIRSEENSNESGTKTIWDYIQIRLNSRPEYKKCVESLIREFITQSQEFDLINSANRVLLNLGTETEVPAEYVEYLNLVDEIKSNVKKDFGM